MPRLAAWTALRSGSLAPLRELEAIARARGLDERDTALARKLLGVEIRRRATLRAILRHVDARLARNADLAAHLHVALAQVFFLDRVPEHAVRSEALDAVRRTLGPSKVRVAREAIEAAYALRREGCCNDPTRDVALRGLHLAESVFADPASHPLVWAEEALSMPAAIVKRWTARFGEARALELARQALEEPPLSLRVVRGEREALIAELGALGVPGRRGTHPSIVLAPSEHATAVLASVAFAEGRITVQGETALRAAEAVGARECERALDLCCAPGGKTAVIAASGARVVACDVSLAKLARARETLARLGVADGVALAATDGGAALRGERFDAVLVDAPCSNTGVLAQRPEARWRFGPQSKSELAALQTRLFDRAAELVRPGGRLVWSTCALESDENRRAVERFLARHAGWSLAAESESLPDAATTQSEGAGPIDGGYFARLVRSARDGG
jgi:16S rRNA (cytosine967-C5)-methyltransferase